MSNSQHPVALRIERLAGDGARLLATVMCLPLVDGIFPALVLAGALSGVLGVLEVGLLVFGGSATVAVILAEMDGTPRENARSVLLIGALIVPVAGIEAALAPTIAGLVDLAVFERFAALVILAVAARTASARIGDVLPGPGTIIGLGLLASIDPAGARFVATLDPELVGRAVAAAAVGVVFALCVAWFGARLRTLVVIDRFRFGSAVALGVFGLSILGVVPGEAPIALSVLCVTGLFALDPGGEEADTSAADPTARTERPETDRAPSGHDESDRDSDERPAFEDRAPWL